MYPGHWAGKDPGKPAHVMGGSGEAVTYAELEERSRRLAQLMWAAGLRRGDHMALFMENHPRYFEVVWAGLRSGVYVTAVNSHLTAPEVGYILRDCQAQVVVASAALGEVATDLPPEAPDVHTWLAVGGEIAGYEPYEEAIARHPAERLDEEPLGATMLYSSGTTGRPKGVLRPLPNLNVDDERPGVGNMYGFDEETVYLSPAPLYHAAPLAFSLGVQQRGGTVVVMERFDPLHALELIERHRVTHSQWVPTHFVRMFKLSEEERQRYDVSSLRVAVHAAAPCPVDVKRKMIEWWGPILYEYYAGTEGNGSTGITSEEWLEHPGSVGRPRGQVRVRICDEHGDELPTGEPGTIYFEQPEGAPLFQYHNDPDKTAGSRHPKHPNWSTLGDVGYLDDDGYLYLTDRKAHMIISGGVNIYPQEAENVLVTHPKVHDVAVIGVPDPDMGEQVKAVVQPAAGVAAGPELERELLAWCRERLAHYKCPRSVDFEAELPRLPTGKLAKRLVRDRYWTEATAGD